MTHFVCVVCVVKLVCACVVKLVCCEACVCACDSVLLVPCLWGEGGSMLMLVLYNLEKYHHRAKAM